MRSLPGYIIGMRQFISVKRGRRHSIGASARACRILGSITFIAIFACCRSASAAATHPLDPLDAEELIAIRDVLALSDRFSINTNFAWIQLAEPPKKTVTEFRPGADFPRRAYVAAIDYDKGRAFRVIVDLRASRIASLDDLGALQPGLTDRDSAIARDVVDADPGIKQALTRRGLAIPGRVSDSVRLQYMAVGVDPSLDQESNRLLRVLFASDQDAGSDTSPFIDGVMAVVDLYAKKVIRFHDVAGVQSVHVPHDVFASDMHNSTAAAHALVTTQPGGRNFAVDGNVVSWQNWRFRFSFNLREGLVLHQVGFDDSGRTRSILYRASVSEVLTAYGDPNELWAWMQILDEGIFGLGYLSMPLQAGRQVPSNASTLGAVMPDPALPRFSDLFADRIYLYERDGGNLINYSHAGRSVHARASELVVGSQVSLGNYIYALNWVFKQDGSFAFEAELSGSIVTKFVASKTCDTCAAIAQGPGSDGESRTYAASGADKYGSLLLPNLVGVSHQHWFNLRLDFDIDGTGNAVMENNVQRPSRARRNEPAASGAPIEVAHTVLSRAVEARRRLNHDTARTWTIYNPITRNATRRPAGYTLMPLHNASPVFPAWREPETVGFAFHHFWVTPYRDGQLYAAGTYPNQARTDNADTLYSYADNSSIYDKDVVVWYSMGDTHVPRPEDFPLMASKKLSVIFHPDGFFQRNAVFGPQDAASQR